MNAAADPPLLLWIVAFQMGVYAMMWALALVLLRESRGAVAHWTGFMLLLAIGLGLAGLRGEPRTWLHFVGANAATVIGFALMRRGTERFMRVPSSDREQVFVLAPVLALFAWLGAGADDAPLRIVTAYLTQAWILARTLASVRRALAEEFGRSTMLGILVPGVLLVVVLLVLVGRQIVLWPQPSEMHVTNLATTGLMITYLSGSALFSFGFLTLVTRRLIVRLEQASRHDELTGLLNRRAMNEALERLWLHQRRTGAPLAVLAIDLDHFKQVNDTRGHAGGDLVLVQVATLLRALLRSEDVIGRAGGEEFWIVLPDTPAAHAQALAERLRQYVGDADLGTTLSIGIALARPDDAAAQQAVERADAALYRAKDAGRNRVELASD